MYVLENPRVLLPSRRKVPSKSMSSSRNLDLHSYAPSLIFFFSSRFLSSCALVNQRWKVKNADFPWGNNPALTKRRPRNLIAGSAPSTIRRVRKRGERGESCRRDATPVSTVQVVTKQQDDIQDVFGGNFGIRGGKAWLFAFLRHFTLVTRSQSRVSSTRAKRKNKTLPVPNLPNLGLGCSLTGGGATVVVFSRKFVWCCRVFFVCPISARLHYAGTSVPISATL